MYSLSNVGVLQDENVPKDAREIPIRYSPDLSCVMGKGGKHVTVLKQKGHC